MNESEINEITDLAAELRTINPSWRKGQCFFNALYSIAPIKANTIRGNSLFDPYYNDDKIDDCKGFLLDSEKIDTIYIAGKYTGKMPDIAERDFETAENKVRLLHPNSLIINPLKLGIGLQTAWIDAMIICINHLSICNIVYFMPDWNESRGARIEHAISVNCKFEINYL